MQNLYNKNLDLCCAAMAAYIFKLLVTNLSFDRSTFCTSLSSVEIHFQLNRYFTTFIVFSTSRLFIYLCTTFIKRIIHKLICSDALCMRNNVQGTFYIMFCKFMQFNKIFKTIFEYIRKKFRFVHTNTFCEYRKELRASPRVHLVSSFFLFSKKLPIVVVRDVCPSVRLSVRLSSVEIFSFRGNSLSSKPIDLKIGLNVREGVVHVRKA